ncbi:MAG: hypothetical protein WBH01_02775 [Dehalococcoidia bacterium]
MTNGITESEVHALLHERLTEIDDVRLLGWSPPNSKTYGLPNILIPKVVGKRRAGSDRVDACLLYQDIIMLIEIKPASSQMRGDIAKLRRILSYYEPYGLVRILERQGIRIASPIRWLVPVMAFGILNSILSNDFVSWHVTYDYCRQLDGPELSGDAASELQEFRQSFERKLNSLER